MKKTILLITIIFINLNLIAQIPENFKYQSVIRNNSGEVLANQLIGFQMSILQGSSTGTAVYTETFTQITNQFGLVNLNIGEGNTTDNFSTIDWSTGAYFLKISIDETGGTNYVETGTSKLNSVPYAFYAKNVENNNDADFNPTNELQAINFSNDTLYLSNGGQVYLGNYENLWLTHGNDIYNSNTGYVGVGLDNPMGKLVVKGDSTSSDTLPLFEVKNKNGQTIFAVYDGGVRIYVDDNTVGANNEKSGFAVGGYSLNKALTNEYFRVSPDSVRIWITNTVEANNEKGGFAVGGYSLNKTIPDYYMNIYSGDTTYFINPSQARVLWYPAKNAFLAGQILIESPDSIGENSMSIGYETKAIGNYSQSLGYKSRSAGVNSTAIGNNANSSGSNSYAFGNNSLTTNDNSYAIGSGSKAIGLNSFAVGSIGVDSANTETGPTVASGDYSYAFGMGAKSSNQGSFTFGTKVTASGKYSTAIGYITTSSGSFSTSLGGGTKASGIISTAMGYLTTASGSSSTSMGKQSIAKGRISTAAGYNTIAKSFIETVIGVSNDTSISTNATDWIETDPIFAIGNGGLNVLEPRHNALTVLKNGKVGINTLFPDKRLTVDGDVRVTGDIYYGIVGSATIYSKPDFVFNKNYDKNYDIINIEEFIRKNNHLPWLTSAKDEKDGINITRMTFETLEAVENQQLQIIELNKLIIQLKEENAKLKEENSIQLNYLKNEIEILKNK